MLSRQNKMNIKLDDQLLIMQATIYSNMQDFDGKMKKQDSKLDKLTSMVKNMMDNIKILNYSPDNMDSL